MGVEPAINIDKFPRQGTFFGLRCKVCFDRGTKTIGGLIVRDDAQHPWRTIIRLDDGRHVLATECQYQVEIEIQDTPPPAT